MDTIKQFGALNSPAPSDQSAVKNNKQKTLLERLERERERWLSRTEWGIFRNVRSSDQKSWGLLTRWKFTVSQYIEDSFLSSQNK